MHLSSDFLESSKQEEEKKRRGEQCSVRQNASGATQGIYRFGAPTDWRLLL